MRVIVLNCMSRIGLAVINALDPSYEVIGGMLDRPGLGGFRYERYFRHRRLVDVYRHPHPALHIEQFRASVLEACSRYEADAVFPTSTATAIALSQLKEDIPSDLPTKFVVDDWSTLSRLADKWQTYELCQELGVPTPRTILPVGPAEQEVAELPLPIIAKPRNGEASHGIQIFDDRGALEKFLADPPRIGVSADSEYPYIVQEYVDGTIHDGGACAIDGEPLTLYSQQRTVTVYEYGGPSIICQLTDEPPIREGARRLLEGLRWNGVVVFEFIRTPEGEYVFLEGNPRCGAAVQLVVEAGMNVCQQAVDVLVLGKRPTPTLDYPVGMACKWWSGSSLTSCFRKPRTVRAVRQRARALFGPYKPGPTVTNLRWRDLGHLAGITLGNLGTRGGHGAPPPTPETTVATPRADGSTSQSGDDRRDRSAA